MTLRALTVSPTNGWVALPPCPTCGTRKKICSNCGGGRGDPEPGDVLAVVEQCPKRNRPRWAFHCTTCNSHSPGHGWVRTCFVEVVEVLPIARHGYHDDGTRPAVLVENCADPRVWLSRSGQDRELLDLPNAVPGGVALRVEPIECPTCEGSKILERVEADIYRDCPSCSGPVTLRGDGLIREVAS